MPFVQGHLRNASVSVSFRTECAHCARRMQIDVDGQLEYSVAGGADPLIFVPLVNFEKLKDPSIIHAF